LDTEFKAHPIVTVLVLQPGLAVNSKRFTISAEAARMKCLGFSALKVQNMSDSPMNKDMVDGKNPANPWIGSLSH